MLQPFTFTLIHFLFDILDIIIYNTEILLKNALAVGTVIIIRSWFCKNETKIESARPCLSNISLDLYLESIVRSISTHLQSKNRILFKIDLLYIYIKFFNIFRLFVVKNHKVNITNNFMWRTQSLANLVYRYIYACLLYVSTHIRNFIYIPTWQSNFNRVNKLFTPQIRIVFYEYFFFGYKSNHCLRQTCRRIGVWPTSVMLPVNDAFCAHCVSITGNRYNKYLSFSINIYIENTVDGLFENNFYFTVECLIIINIIYIYLISNKTFIVLEV